jgi:hypothetical protein
VTAALAGAGRCGWPGGSAPVGVDDVGAAGRRPSRITVNDRSILERALWPLNTPVPFAVAAGVLSGFSLFRSQRQSQALRDELRGVAGELGLAYEEGNVVVPSEARPKTSLFAQSSRCQNRLSGTSHGAPAQMFDFMTDSRPAEGPAYPTWTVVLFEQTELTVFSCLPDVWWTKGDVLHMSPVKFDPEVGDPMTRQTVAEFQTACKVWLREAATRSEDDEARRLFRTPLMAALARHPGWYIQSADGCLALGRKTCQAGGSARRVLQTGKTHVRGAKGDTGPVTGRVA